MEAKNFTDFYEMQEKEPKPLEEYKPKSLEEYLNHDEMCISVVKKKYLEYPEQPVEEFFERVIDNVCDNSIENEQPDKDEFVKQCKQDWYKGIWKGAGSILSASLLKDRKISTFNCTCLEIQEDSIESIANTRKWAAQMAAHRQGLGVTFSKLRPRGAKINNSAMVSEGAVHWMKSFDNLANEVGQRGRLPAMLFALDVDHPDVEEFITCKDDINNINNANISVFLNDEFMRCVEEDKDYTLSFTCGDGEVIEKTVKTSKLFRKICKQAWKNGEPGVLFKEKCKRYSIQESLGHDIVGVNACRLASSTVLTPNGISTIGRINVGDMIWDGKGWTKVIRKWKTGHKPVYRYFTNAGEFTGTDNHHIVENGKKVEVRNASSIDIATGPKTGEVILDRQAVMDGLVIGDGTVVSRNSEYATPVLCIGQKDGDYFTSEVSSLIGRLRNKYEYYIKTNITVFELPPTYERTVPDRYFYGDTNTVASFLRGLFSANGNVLNSKRSKRVCLKQSSFELVKQVQMMLSSLGIYSYITKHEATWTTHKNGRYLSKPTYDINITRDVGVFCEKVGFIQKYKQTRLEQIVSIPHTGRKRSFDITNSVCLGTEDVYEITVDNEAHVYWSEGSLVSNCSEKSLSNQGVCCLAPLNMEFVPNPLTDQENFNNFMKTVVPRMVRFMDNVVQFELDHPHKSPTIKQRESVQQLREIGLGILNLHKWFYNNGVAYGSEESIKMTEAFFKQYQYEAFKASCELAQKRKPCQAWLLAKAQNKLHSMTTPFLDHLFEAFPNLKEMYFKHGLRNAALLSVAPTGTISMTFPNMLSTGIEPLMGYAYWRRTRALSNNQGYENFFVLPHTIKTMLLDSISKSSESSQEDYDLIKNTPISQADQDGAIGKKVIQILDKYLDTKLIQPSHLVDPFQKIKLMAAAQRWIDASISVTYNVPFTFTEEDTQRLYMEAYKSGLKSITIYRDGSREGIYIFEDPITYAKKLQKLYGTVEPVQEDRPMVIQYQRAPKRPEELPCEIHHTSIRGEQWLVLVGMLNDAPYEIFAGKKNEDFNISKGIQAGRIIKEAKGVYTLRIHTASSWIDYHNITDLFMNVEYKALTRLVSLSLRHGVYSEHIISQLKKSSDFVSDFMAVISRVLSKYVGSIKVGKVCPQCGASIVRIEGCEKCSAECGYSRCE